MSLCRCPDRIYQLTADGRKPIRCALCGRRAFRRRPRERLLTWLAWHFPRLAGRVLR
jgi:hypothetical protein